MIVNQGALSNIYKGFSVIFREAYDVAAPLYTRIATVVPSSTKSMDYKWLGKLQSLRQWVGERQIQNLSAYSYTIVNEKWEGTVGVDRLDILGDTIGVYSPIIQALGESAALHPDEQIFPLLAGGFTAKCYDGDYVFGDNHPDDKGNLQSNLMHGVLNPTNYGAARAKMMAFKDNAGKQMNIMPDLLIVPPQLEQMGLEIIRADRMADGASNVYKNSADLMVAPLLAGNPQAWYLLSTKKAIKPFIFQQWEAPEFTALDKPSDENVFMNDEFLYGVHSTDNVGYSLWFLAVGSDGTK
jgi:phage major head subunit gpT-like protein